jgi:uridine kinase
MSEALTDTVTITLEDGSTREIPRGAHIKAVLDGPVAANGLTVIAALVNNDITSLSYAVEVDSQVQFITLADRQGRKVYRRSLSFLLARAVNELYPDADLYIEHALGNGYYCTFETNGDEPAEDRLQAIETKMRELVDRDLPIERRKLGFEDAVANLLAEGQDDKYGLLRFRNPPKVIVYHCDGFTDVAHGPLAGSTGAIEHFKLLPYESGFVLQFPSRENPTELEAFRPQPHLFEIFKAHKNWGKTLGVRTVSQLNDLVASKQIHEFVRITEAKHEKQIAELADQITSQAQRIRYVMIAGPSCAGKTTFAKRLGVQLKVNGLEPVSISSDNYFVNRGESPLDESGNPDFEHLETIDLALLNQHLHDLVNGDSVIVPEFDFKAGQKIYHEKNKVAVHPDQIIIMEGIHGLNPRLTEALDDNQKFKIYLSALTQLNLDKNNRISTTDNRLIRRMVRDNQFRGHSALDTLRMWPSVRRGEDRWIFPFQVHADAAFNSALDYELAVLRPMVEPLLAEVKPRHEEYAEARRLEDFLRSIVGISHELVTDNSLLREFIGRSSFTY